MELQRVIGFFVFAWLVNSFMGAATVLCANAPQQSAASTPLPSALKPAENEQDPDIVFKELTLDGSVTSFDMTEDGKFLVLSHQEADQLSIYDILNRKVVQTISTPSPRGVLCRGNSVFVANYGHATISVITHRENWHSTAKLKVIKPNIVHMSAPAGPNFKNELLVTCHGAGAEGSYKDCHNYLLSTQKSLCREIGQVSSLSVSSDGKLVYVQRTFRGSPSGGISVYPYKNFVAGSKEEPVTTGGNGQTPYVYQIPTSNYWLSKNVIFGGTPVQQIKSEFGKLIVPDMSQKIFYAIDEDVVRAHKFNSTFSEFPMRRAKYPKGYEDFSDVCQHFYRMNDYYLDHPVAYTHGDLLFMFVLTAKGGMILAAETEAFQSKSTSLSPEPSPAASFDTSDKTTSQPEPSKLQVPKVPSSSDTRVRPSVAENISSLKTPNKPIESTDQSKRAGIEPGNISDTIELCERSVVRIQVESKEGGGQGSGFVVGPGIIATNVHVLAGAETATVVFPNEKTFTIAGVLFVDAERDIALVKLVGDDALSLPVLKFSNNLPRKGQRIVALGSPLGLSFTATSGVVSAIRSSEELSRELGQPDLSGTWIQVDAALSPGNSGGPIVDDEGTVVAMSTLASARAQNLNFGISADDIRDAMANVDSKKVVPLESDDVLVLQGNRKRKAGTRSNIRVPSKAVEAYVARGRAEFKEIKRSLAQELSRLRNDLKEMRDGATTIPSSVNKRNADVVRVPQSSRKTSSWYFRSEDVKSAELKQAEARLKDLSKINLQVTDPSDDQALLTLLSKYGPPIETREDGSVGFLSNCLVVRAFNAHDVLVTKDDIPYMLYLESTAGLWLGQEIMPLPVFVCGTTVAEVENSPSTSLTVLCGVSKEQLKAAIDIGFKRESESLGSKADALKSNAVDKFQSNTFRTWRDKSGKFSIEAKLLELTPTEVILRKVDGSTTRVLRDRISESDQIYADQFVNKPKQD